LVDNADRMTKKQKTNINVKFVQEKKKSGSSQNINAGKFAQI
jgi:hypothetical protein